jgi:hypothetical protein
MRETEKAALRKRLDVADRVLERIQKAHADPAAQLSYEEYQEILSALTDPNISSEKAADSELSQVRGWGLGGVRRVGGRRCCVHAGDVYECACVLGG